MFWSACQSKIFCPVSAPVITFTAYSGLLMQTKIFADYSNVIRKAWEAYDATKIISTIEDISPMVSTNFVFRITFEDEDIIIAKLSHFGKYERFKEDHRIIHTLSNNLLYPYDHLQKRALVL